MNRLYAPRFIWATGILAAINFAVLNALHLIWFEPLNGGEKLFDGRFLGYGIETARNIVSNLGPDGREAHLFWHNTVFDWTFPILLSAFSILLILRLGENMPRFAKIRMPWKVGFAAGIVLPYTFADFAENNAVGQLMKNGPPVNEGTVVLASALTLTKWSFVAINLAVITLFFFASRGKHPDAFSERGDTQ